MHLVDQWPCFALVAISPAGSRYRRIWHIVHRFGLISSFCLSHGNLSYWYDGLFERRPGARAVEWRGLGGVSAGPAGAGHGQGRGVSTGHGITGRPQRARMPPDSTRQRFRMRPRIPTSPHPWEKKEKIRTALLT
jgi:hypothetical protein